jgi:large subunit ribosomal protein L21
MYAIINISGKQFKASEGVRVRVPKQVGDEGTTLTFDNVLLVSDGVDTQVGSPTVQGASVTATILDHGRDKKILVYKKKRRKGYQRKNGHRQWYTELEFQKINASSSKKTKAASKKVEPIVEESAQEEE